MKKIIFLNFTLLLLIILFTCKPKSPQVMPNAPSSTDIQIPTSTFTANVTETETETETNTPTNTVTETATITPTCSTIFYRDYDGDGYGINLAYIYSCFPSPPYTTIQSGDCDDSDPLVNPGQIEICNNKDDNCDGNIDEENSQGCNVYYYDLDGDTYGITGNYKCMCSVSGNYRAPG